MTIAGLKQSMDRRFRSMERRSVRFERETDRRFREVRREIARSAEETRRHVDVVIESLRDDFRIFADAIARHTERLDQHELRIGRLERRAL